MWTSDVSRGIVNIGLRQHVRNSTDTVRHFDELSEKVSRVISSVHFAHKGLLPLLVHAIATLNFDAASQKLLRRLRAACCYILAPFFLQLDNFLALECHRDTRRF